jgi:uracil phosphoribosyltransferase
VEIVCEPLATLRLALQVMKMTSKPKFIAPKNLTVVDHPLVLHKLTLMRDKHTPSAVFRQLLHEISHLLAYEVCRDLPLTMQTIETPVAEMEAPILKGKKLVIVSVLRAGNGLLEGMLSLIPSARVGHIGLYRNPETLQPVEYYLKVPEDISERRTIVVDPMLATGNSVSAAVKRLKEKGAKDIRLATLLSAPEGIMNFHEQHPDVPIFTLCLVLVMLETACSAPSDFHEPLIMVEVST